MTTLSYDPDLQTSNGTQFMHNHLMDLQQVPNAIRVSGTDYTGSVASTANTVAVRDADGDVYANLFQGTATTAKYADLAEMYANNEDLPVGTAVAVGGDAEIRPAKAS